MLKNVRVLISFLEKSSAIATSFESYSELVSSSLENPSERMKEQISVG